MKKKIKNTIFSLLVAIALLLSGNFPLAFAAVNTLKNSTTNAEYKPTDFISPYDFTSSTTSTWSLKTVSSSSVSSKITKSTSQNISTLTEYKPLYNYKGDSTDVTGGSPTDFGVLYISAKDLPTTTTKEKTDKNGHTIWETDENGDVVVITDEHGAPVKYTSNNGDTERYIEQPDGSYHQKKAQHEPYNVYAYYQTNTSLSLKANSWYVIVAYVYARDAKATLMVSGTNFEKAITIDPMAADASWQKVYLFLETASDSTNSVNLRFYYGTADGVSENTTAGAVANGAVMLDQVSVQTISKTEYVNKTIGGEETTENAIVQEYSARYNYDIEAINNRFENVQDNGDGTYAFNLYEKLYGANDYDENANELVNLKYYQYYINKYTADDGKTKLTDKQIGLYHKAYNEKLTTSVVLEGKEFETEEEIYDENDQPVIDGDGNIKTEKVPGFSTFNTNNHALKLVNQSEKYSLGILSAPIAVKQFSYYKLTLFAKGLSKEDSATVKLISYIKTGTNALEGAMQVKSQTVSPYTTTSDNTNNWTEITFYIQGSSYYPTEFRIALLADKESTVYYDDIRLESITNSTYTSATSAKKFDLFPSTTAINSSIANGNFDMVSIDNANPSEVKAPYTPASWSVIENSSKDMVAGIISTQDQFYSTDTHKDGKTIQELLGGAANPIQPYEYNSQTINPPRINILAMHAPKLVDSEEITHKYGYKSSSISLSSNSAYRITFQVYLSNTTSDSDFAGKIYANLLVSDKNIAEFETVIEAADADKKGGWITYTFAVRTGSSSRTAYLELGIKDAVGTAFFRKVNYKKLAEKTVDEEKISVDKQFDEIKAEFNTVEKQTVSNIKFADFESDPLLMHSENKVENKDYYKSLSHSLRTKEDDKNTEVDESIIEQGEMGIIDTAEADGALLSTDLNLVLNKAFVINPKASSDFAMVIYNQNNYYTQVLPNTDVSLSSKSFYEISVYVKTKDIQSGKGLKITLDKISVAFNNINTQSNEYGDLTDSNGYKKFTAYVRTGESTISGLKIMYELGKESDKITGIALLSELKITKLANQEAFDELVNSVDANDSTTVVKNFAPAEQEHEHSHDHADNSTLATFFLVFSSILLVAVLAFALISISVRKVPVAKTVTGTNKANLNKKDTDVQKDGFV